MKFVKVETNVPQDHATFISNIFPEQRSVKSALNIGIRLQQHDHILNSHHRENLKNYMIIFLIILQK